MTAAALHSTTRTTCSRRIGCGSMRRAARPHSGFAAMRRRRSRRPERAETRCSKAPRASSTGMAPRPRVRRFCLFSMASPPRLLSQVERLQLATERALSLAGRRTRGRAELADHTRELRGELRRPRPPNRPCPRAPRPCVDPRTHVLGLFPSPSLPRPGLTPPCPGDQFVVLLSLFAAVTTDFGPGDIPEDQWPGACTGVGTCMEKIDNAGVDDILYRQR